MPFKDDEHHKQEATPRVPDATRPGAPLLPAEMEAAWLAWSRTMRDLDFRTMLLLRAAFQAGYEARG